ncbi:MAG: high-affinity Zn(2+) transporter zrt1 [Icmadophila ericetorum]|nr:high-affinity Zn(2+) transporter zrt1 [Icmadophila ericetorum]
MSFDPANVNLNTADPAQVVCYIESDGNDYDGRLGARVSALFVILIVSTATTFFPVVARRVRWLKIPLYVYLFARYFGAGVIVATSFIHLLDPAYAEIGPNTCVGMTGNWAVYSWPPAIVLVSVMMIFLLDFCAERYVELKYGEQDGGDMQEAVTGHADGPSTEKMHGDAILEDGNHSNIESATAEKSAITAQNAYMSKFDGADVSEEEMDEKARARSFQTQIAAFLILEFGVIFHSVIIGLNLGVAGSEFTILFPVLVFHQSFEGLGIGARMSAIPFKRSSWLPWLLCSAYGLTTPIAIAIGLGLRTTYDPGSFTAQVVSGVLDSMSAGILIYTGLVELLARDFLFNPYRTKDTRRIIFMLACVFVGAGVMALLGKWA